MERGGSRGGYGGAGRGRGRGGAGRGRDGRRGGGGGRGRDGRRGGGSGRGGDGRGGGGGGRDGNWQDVRSYNPPYQQPLRPQNPAEGGDYHESQEIVIGSGRGVGGGSGVDQSGVSTRGGHGGDREVNAPSPPVKPLRGSYLKAVADDITPKVKSVTISDQLRLSSPKTESVKISDQLRLYSPGNAGRKLPVRRPDRGGTDAIYDVNLHVNHFPVAYESKGRILHYDVDIKPKMLPKNGCPMKIPKSNMAMVRNKLFTDDPDQFPLSMTAYDGEKNIFSAKQLPTGEFTVEFSEAEDMKIRSYSFTIKFVNELKFSKLDDCFGGMLSSIPRDVLQGMDLVLKENPSRRMISVGRSFYSLNANEEVNLGFGTKASSGYQHSLKPTSQGLALCLDYSILAFLKPIAVLEFLKENILGFNLHNFSIRRKAVEEVLKGLKVTVTHRTTKQKFTILRLSPENTEDSKFTVENPEDKIPCKEIRLVDYFRDKYGKDIRYKNIPCLDVGTKNRKNYVPMEFCVILDRQRYPKENLDKHEKLSAAFKKKSLAPPLDRRQKICNFVKSEDGPCGGYITQNFGMNIKMEMTQVKGRIIQPPVLKSGNLKNIIINREECHWNFVGKSVMEGKTIPPWAIVDFSSRKLSEEKLECSLMSRCRTLGIRMQWPCLYRASNMTTIKEVGLLEQLLQDIKGQVGNLEFLLCVMSHKDPGYKNIKWICETKLGIMTQCCLVDAFNDGKDQYFVNLALKINAKLGGSNVELVDWLPCFEGGHVMFIGADVNHPGPSNTTSPSIAAVVASVNWPAANRYAARVRPQDHRNEKILNFGDMCMELVETYACINRAKPEKIVVFRDGVSEGQFDMVLNEELIDLKMALQRANYTPTITLVVAQKRHQTRLFPDGQRNGSSTGNVRSGTVVDTIIVHPTEFDFYLCSHHGNIGTSKPTHYYVLWDEHKFTSDQLQKLIYRMCFIFARCTKPVSLVPPVYYADLVAYRGRLYYEAGMGVQCPASAILSTASSSVSSATSFDERCFKLHANLENNMFFV